MSKRDIVNELHKPARKNFKRRQVITKGIDDLWQADLIEMGAYANENNGYRFLLTVIDTFSKFSWAIALKNKTGNEVTKAFKNIINLGRKPRFLQTDDGKEFFNKQFQSLMTENKIKHYSTYSNLKASIVERFNRTLKSLMWKEFNVQSSYKWVKILSKLLNHYNNSKHRTINMKPSEVNKCNEQYILKRLYDINKDNSKKVNQFKPSKLKVGDYVRISKFKHIFEKGYTPNWTTEVFKIRSIQNTNPLTYLLSDYNERPILGGFYAYELLKTKHPNTYLVEKVLKIRGNKVLMKWLGFPNEHNSLNKKK